MKNTLIHGILTEKIKEHDHFLFTVSLYSSEYIEEYLLKYPLTYNNFVVGDNVIIGLEKGTLLKLYKTPKLQLLKTA